MRLSPLTCVLNLISLIYNRLYGLLKRSVNLFTICLGFLANLKVTGTEVLNCDLVSNVVCGSCFLKEEYTKVLMFSCLLALRGLHHNPRSDSWYLPGRNMSRDIM